MPRHELVPAPKRIKGAKPSARSNRPHRPADISAPRPARTSYKACTDFIERFGAEAVRLGWTAPQIFGAHPGHGTLRVDWCGVMITGGHKAIGKRAEQDPVRQRERLSGHARRAGWQSRDPPWTPGLRYWASFPSMVGQIGRSTHACTIGLCAIYPRQATTATYQYPGFKLRCLAERRVSFIA